MKEIKKEDVQKKRKILLAKMSKHTELVQKLKEAVVINKTQSIMAKSQKFSQLVEEREENVEKAKRVSRIKIYYKKLLNLHQIYLIYLIFI